jgi:type IV secretion system protein VirB4
LQPAHGTFLVKQGTRSVVAQLPLAGMIDELTVLSGTARSVRLLDKARADVGDDPAAMLARFHEIRKSEAFA